MATKKKAVAVKKKAVKKISVIKSLVRAEAPDTAPDAIAKDPPDALLDHGGGDIPADGALRSIAILTELQLKRERTVADAELALKSALAELKEVQEDLLPEAMREAGVASFTLTDGRELTVKDDLSCSLDKQGPIRDKAIKWLEKYDLDGIIKRGVILKFGKGEEKRAEEALRLLMKAKFDPSVVEGIHPQTLKATLKEVVAKGIVLKGQKKPKRINVPLELFNGHPYSKAIIK